jgi:hypothetical protein
MNATRRSHRARPFNPAVLARLGVAAIALLVVACQTPAAAPPSSPSSPPVSAGNPSTPPASPSLPVTPTPSADPSSPAPTPTPKPPAPKPPVVKPVAWSKPVAVKGLEGCLSVVMAVDDLGATHLAATCGIDSSEIRYAVSTDGTSWKTTTLAAPAGRQELEPQLAFSGSTLYLAYTRVAPTDGGCGDDGLADLGVHVRSRSLPGGPWSEPSQIGKAADHLQSLRVDGSVIHATVRNDKDRSTAYEVLTGGALARQVIGDATGGSSLRVGDDGKGRVAYETAKGISFGTVQNGRFVGARIPGSASGHSPVLTLAGGNVAYVIWSRHYVDGGCIDGGSNPLDGTYIATNASGRWVTSRLTTMVGAASMTIDQVTGELQLVVSDMHRIVRFHKGSGGEWAKETLTRRNPTSSVIRQNPTNGNLVVAFIADPTYEMAKMHVEVMVGR